MMGGMIVVLRFVSFMEIVVFAVLALYLFFRLWGVLGTRTGKEKQVNPLEKSAQAKESENVIVLPRRSKPPVQVVQKEFSSSVAGQINHLMTVDKSFDPSIFLKNSKAAFVTIITSYTEANHMTLKKLLSSDVYEQFAAAIQEREKKNLRQETEIEDVKAEILTVDVLEDRAQITVRFESRQMVATFNQENQSFDNPARLQVPMKDVWTFERLLNSKKPTWVLIRTRNETAS